MPTFIVCPDGSTYTLGKLTPTEAGGRAVDADSAEDALHVAYADGYASFPAMPHSRGVHNWTGLRDARILAAARRVIAATGMRGVSRAALAREANMASGTISNFGRTKYKADTNPTEGYRERVLAALMADAVDKADIGLIRAGVADGCLSTDVVPEGLRAAVGV
jgi:AcrR family transcriptional regulator